MNNLKLLTIIFITVLLAGCSSGNGRAKTETAPAPTAPKSSAASFILIAPISSATKRVTKKPFGLKVSPNNSPVKPEKFSGYHTGVDFEILPGEESQEVSISAVCSGNLIYKNYVNGYGGVAIQSCKIANQAVTVLYGHLKLASILGKLNTNIKAGDKIAVLGKGYSSETSGERKHLHLGIHKGTKIDLRGYVNAKPELNNWLDAMKYLSS